MSRYQFEIVLEHTSSDLHRHRQNILCGNVVLVRSVSVGAGYVTLNMNTFINDILKNICRVCRATRLARSMSVDMNGPLVVQEGWGEEADPYLVTCLFLYVTCLHYRMAKSEINLLQELAVKQGFSPVYNFMEKTTERNNPQFVCNVSCKEFKTHGAGISKKEAKHNAARNMLSLLVTNKQISLPAGTSSPVKSAIQSPANSPAKTYEMSPSSIQPAIDRNYFGLRLLHKNTVQSPVKTYETSPSSVQSTTDRNYVGLLQETCQQLKISVSNISYKIIREEGPPHMKYFTIEVSVGSARKTATAQCKKAAKQEAAKKLLLHLNSDVVNSNTASRSVANPSITGPINIIALPNVPNTNVLLGTNKVAANNMNTLENSMRKLGIEILESVANKPTLPVAMLSEKATSLYLESTNKEDKRAKQDTKSINNSHNLFERNYSSKISYSMKEKMRITRDKCDDRIDLMREISKDIERALGVKIEQVAVRSLTKNYVICLRLLSSPRITQFGLGETKVIAQRRAMYNLMASVLTFLNV